MTMTGTRLLARHMVPTRQQKIGVRRTGEKFEMWTVSSTRKLISSLQRNAQGSEEVYNEVKRFI